MNQLNKLASDALEGSNRSASLSWTSEYGASAIEYAIVASLIALAIAFTVSALGVALGNLYDQIANAFP
jgi:Flp pilus assembly pilin Flp